MLENIRGTIAVAVLISGSLLWLGVLGASAVMGVQHVLKSAKPAEQHAEITPPASAPSTDRLDAGTAADLPAGAATDALGLFLDGSLVAVVGTWNDGRMHIVTPMSPEGQTRRMVEAVQGAPHERILISSHCTP